MNSKPNTAGTLGNRVDFRIDPDAEAGEVTAALAAVLISMVRAERKSIVRDKEK